jgi:hypothetical protein
MISQELLLELFVYKDGQLLHKNKLKNGLQAGSIVGTKDKDGYLKTLIKRKAYRLHRLVWIMHHGYEPKVLDHINGIPDDNRIENLREATHSQNNLNRRMHKRNITGYKGVSWIAPRKMYRASLHINGIKYVFGHYKTAEEAYTVYCNEVKNRCGEFGRIA